MSGETVVIKVPARAWREAEKKAARAMANAPVGTPIEVWVGSERAYIAMRTKDFAKALARGPR